MQADRTSTRIRREITSLIPGGAWHGWFYNPETGSADAAPVVAFAAINVRTEVRDLSDALIQAWDGQELMPVFSRDGGYSLKVLPDDDDLTNWLGLSPTVVPPYGLGEQIEARRAKDTVLAAARLSTATNEA